MDACPKFLRVRAGMLHGQVRGNSLERPPACLHDPTLCAISSPRIRIPSHAFNPSKHATDSQPFPRSGDQNSPREE